MAILMFDVQASLRDTPHRCFGDWSSGPHHHQTPGLSRQWFGEEREKTKKQEGCLNMNGCRKEKIVCFLRKDGASGASYASNGMEMKIEYAGCAMTEDTQVMNVRSSLKAKNCGCLRAEYAEAQVTKR
jgi:hypothetical protein